MLNDLLCEIHGTRLRCLGGCSAHPDNWYCKKCDEEAEARMKLSEHSERVERLVMLHEAPDLPALADNGLRRECVIELNITGEWLTAVYNEATEKWNPTYSEPADELPKWSVAQWAYLDSLFAT